MMLRYSFGENVAAAAIEAAVEKAVIGGVRTGIAFGLDSAVRRRWAQPLLQIYKPQFICILNDLSSNVSVRFVFVHESDLVFYTFL